MLRHFLCWRHPAPLFCQPFGYKKIIPRDGRVLPWAPEPRYPRLSIQFGLAFEFLSWAMTWEHQPTPWATVWRWLTPRWSTACTRTYALGWPQCTLFSKFFAPLISLDIKWPADYEERKLGQRRRWGKAENRDYAETVLHRGYLPAAWWSLSWSHQCMSTSKQKQVFPFHKAGENVSVVCFPLFAYTW